MAYMKKNVNVFLLLVIVIIVASLAGLTTYYQMTYTSLGDKYSVKEKEIEKKIHELNALGSELNQTSRELGIKAEREEKLGEQYTGVKTEKKHLEDQLSEAQAGLERETLLRQTAQTELQQVQYTLQVANDQIQDLRNDVAHFREAAQSCSTSLNSCRASLASCPSGGG